MYIKRLAEKSVIKMSSEFPIVLITGARQIGKTTLLYNLKSKERQYVTLDNLAYRELALQDPVGFLNRFPAPLIIDEFQYAPNLLSYIKIIIDQKRLENEDVNGAYWLTGSQNFVMMKDISESLTGRIGIIELTSFSKSEINGQAETFFIPDIEYLKTKKPGKLQNSLEIFNDIIAGGMPDIVTNKISPDAFFQSYVKTYIERDIRSLTQVGDEITFYKFMVCLASRTAQELKYATLSNEVGVSEPTIKRWISLLVNSGIIYLLEPYFLNIKTRVIKSPKIYFLDTGLCCYLTKWNNAENLEISSMSGALFENYVISEIIKSFLNTGKKPPLYFYRDQNQREIDLLLIENGIVYPIEIKKNYYPNRESTKHFHLAEMMGKTKNGLIICPTDEILPIPNSNNFLLPIRYL